MGRSWKRSLLACSLAASLLLQPKQAHAGGGGYVEFALIVAVLGLGVVAAVEIPTAMATYKNYRTAAREEEPSKGWVGVGAVGGLLNMGAGSLSFAHGLPGPIEVPCPYEPSRTSYRRCTRPGPASPGYVVIGALLFGWGAFALGSSVAAGLSKPSGTGSGPASPGASPAALGLTLPLMRF
jgi:hypothetical protein